MRLDVRIRKVDQTKNTTKFEPASESPPMKDFYANTEVVSSLPSDTGDLVLSISTTPFTDGEVALAFPRVPFFKEFGRVVRYEHRITRRGKERGAPNTPELPVTLAYVNKSDLEDEFVADQEPIFFGLSPVTEAVSGDQKQSAVEDVGVDEEIGGADALAAFDAFLRDTIRVKRGNRLTSRQIWAMWAARCGVHPDDEVIGGLKLIDVARRFRAVFGVTMVETSTRIDGIHQRYWDGYTV